jgi:hypothetical protein
MNKKGLLIGAYWFTMYTTFISILTLVFFVFENPNNASSNEIIKDAKQGQAILTALAKRSMAADRCARTLHGLFEEFEKIRHDAAANRKKRNASPRPQPAALRSDPDLAGQNIEDAKSSQQPQRASTFPDKLYGKASSASKRSSFPHSSYATNTGSDNNAHNNNNTTTTTSPRDSYIQSPTSEQMPGIVTPDTGSAASRDNNNNKMPYNTTYLNPQHHTTRGPTMGMNMPQNSLPDLSPLMFPSGDPFAYPNQPLTALEGAPLGSKDFNLPPGFYSPMQPNNPSSRNSSGFDQDMNDEVQILGSLPPYLMHGQQAGMNMGLGLGDFSTESMMADGWNGQQNNININNDSAREYWGWNVGGGFQG